MNIFCLILFTILHTIHCKMLRGVSLSGLEFSVDSDGSVAANPRPMQPPLWHINHFVSQGVNVFRIPFAWQYMQDSFGPLNEGYFQQYNQVVQNVLNQGAWAIIDMHNYARYEHGIIGQGGPSDDHFADIWGKLAQRYAGNDRVIFGLQNEPHDLDLSKWKETLQRAVNSIRSNGATSQYIILPGSLYSHPEEFQNSFNYLKDIVDSDGSKWRLLLEIHKYLDSDGSGLTPDCSNNGVEDMKRVHEILVNSNRQAFITETGGGNNQNCIDRAGEFIDFLQFHASSFFGWIVWSAGSFSEDYTLSVVPSSNGEDRPIWKSSYKLRLPHH